MRTATLLLITVCFCSFSFAQNIVDLETFEKAVKVGSQLNYDVVNKDKKYKLTITIKKLGDEIAFEWKTEDPDNKSGSVAMTANATQKSTALVTAFKAGDIKLDNETTLWISKKLFNEIATTAQATLKLNGASDTVTTLSNTIGEFNFSMDGNLMAIPGWELQGGPDNKYIIDVLESKIPIIYKIDLGWSMILTEVKNQ